MIISKELQSELREKYSPDGSKLRTIQLQLLEMLQWIDKLCKEHSLTYWISSGTVLGAVRHGGFIPWDDDLDIEMPEKDYHKLCEIMKYISDCPYDLQTHKTDPNYYYQFGKLRNEKVKISESTGIDINYNFKGIFIDIFPVTDKFNTHIQYFGGLWQSACVVLSTKSLFFRLFVKYLLYPIGKYVFWPIINKLIKKDSSEYAMCLGIGKWKKRMKCDIIPTQLIIFEGYKVNAPANPDSYLRNIYGNYTEFVIDHTHLQL